MKLTVTTPLAIIVDVDGITHIRAEDESGAFGILPGHADFMTALDSSVITWRDEKAAEHHVAVRSGMLSIRGGQTVAVATREAIANDDLHWLRSEVLASFSRRLDEERAARADAQRLYLSAIRQIYRYLNPERATFPTGGAPVARLAEPLP